MSGSSVAVTGIGVIAPGATGVAELEEFLRNGMTGVGPLDRFDTSQLNAKTAALVRDFKPKSFIPVLKMRRMNGLSRYAVAAAKLALSDAKFEDGVVERSRAGVALGSAFGPVQTSVEYIDEYMSKGAALAPPQLFPESVANAPGSHIAIEHHFEGFNLTFTQRESSALTAAMFAASKIAASEADAAVTGGVEELNDIIFGVLDRLGALTTNGAGARPFDRARSGMVMGEGSGMLVLESVDLRRDGIVPYGYFTGFASGRDRSATLSDWGTEAETVAAVMRAAVADAGLDIGDVDAIWASANGSVRGDLLEARAISLLFGEAMPPIVAMKGAIGEYAGAGAVHLASALIALRGQFLPVTAGFSDSLEEVALPVTTSFQERPLRHILVNALSAGGGVICAVISREPV